MDNFLSIYLPPETDLSGYGFEIPMYEWAGEKFPQGPSELNFENKYRVVVNDRNRRHIQRFIPLAMKPESWVQLDMDLYHVGDMEELFLAENDRNDKSVLEDFFMFILGKSKYWVVSYVIADRFIQQIYYSDIEGLFPTLKRALLDKMGVIVYSDELYNYIQA